VRLFNALGGEVAPSVDAYVAMNLLHSDIFLLPMSQNMLRLIF
jgi:hypothetical protein